MKRIAATLAAICMLGLSVSVSAAAVQSYFWDVCDGTDHGTAVTVQGLHTVPNVGSALLVGKVPDPNALALPQSGADGSVTYQISGAESLELSFYSKSSAFMSQKEGIWYPGLPELGDGSGQYPLFLEPQSGMAYGQANGQAYQMQAQDGLMVLQPIPKMPEVVNLGVQVSCSKDGRTYTDLLWQGPCSGVEVFRKMGVVCYLEHRSYRIPPNTRYIRVSLNDFTQLPGQGGGWSNRVPQPVLLADVKIMGRDLVLGDAPSSTAPPLPDGFVPNTSAPQKPDGSEPLPPVPPSSNPQPPTWTGSTDTNSHSASASSASSSKSSRSTPSSTAASKAEKEKGESKSSKHPSKPAKAAQVSDREPDIPPKAAQPPQSQQVAVVQAQTTKSSHGSWNWVLLLYALICIGVGRALYQLRR